MLQLLESEVASSDEPFNKEAAGATGLEPGKETMLHVQLPSGCAVHHPPAQWLPGGGWHVFCPAAGHVHDVFGMLCPFTSTQYGSLHARALGTWAQLVPVTLHVAPPNDETQR